MMRRLGVSVVIYRVTASRALGGSASARTGRLGEPRTSKVTAHCSSILWDAISKAQAGLAAGGATSPVQCALGGVGSGAPISAGGLPCGSGESGNVVCKRLSRSMRTSNETSGMHAVLTPGGACFRATATAPRGGSVDGELPVIRGSSSRAGAEGVSPRLRPSTEQTGSGGISAGWVGFPDTAACSSEALSGALGTPVHCCLLPGSALCSNCGAVTAGAL